MSDKSGRGSFAANSSLIAPTSHVLNLLLGWFIFCNLKSVNCKTVCVVINSDELFIFMVLKELGGRKKY